MGDDEVLKAGGEPLLKVDGVNVHTFQLADLGEDAVNLTFEVSFDRRNSRGEITPRVLKEVLELAGFDQVAAGKGWPAFCLKPLNYTLEPCGADPSGNHMIISLNMSPGAYTVQAVLDVEAINDPRVASLMDSLIMEHHSKVLVALGQYGTEGDEKTVAFLMAGIDIDRLRELVTKRGLAILKMELLDADEETSAS